MKPCSFCVSALFLFAVLCASGNIVYAQQPPQPPAPGQGDEFVDKIKGELAKVAEEAARKAADAGEDEDGIKKAAEEAAKKKAEEEIENLIQKVAGPGGQNDPRVGALKERGKIAAEKAAKDAAAEAAKKVPSRWIELEPVEELAKEDTAKAKEIEEKFKETTIFEDFKNLAEHKGKRPVVIYIYVKDEGDKTSAKKAEKCAEMKKNILDKQEFKDASLKFTACRVNLDKMPKFLVNKYGLSPAPGIIFFDASGKTKLLKVSSAKEKVETLVKKMEKFVEDSAKQPEKPPEKPKDG